MIARLGLALRLAVRFALAAVLLVLPLALTPCPAGGQLARQPRTPTRISPQLLGQPISARLTVLLILGLIGRDRDPDQLLGDLREINARLRASRSRAASSHQAR